MRHLCLAALLLPSMAVANGYQNLHQSAVGLGTAYSANGTGIDDISAMYSNPASIMRFSGTNFTNGSSLILPKDSFENLSATTATGATVTGFPLVPTQFLDTTLGGFAYGSHQINDRLTIGVSFNAPWATESDYTSTAASRYTATTTDLTAYNLGLVLGYRVTPRLSFGASINAQYYDSNFATNLPTSLTDPTAATDVQARFSGTNLALGYTVGLEYQATDATRFGISYRSAIEHDFDGDINLIGTPANFTALQGLVPGLQPMGSAFYSINTPWMLQLGVHHEVNERLELYGSATLTGWSRFNDTIIDSTNGLPQIQVRNGWNNAWYVAAGAGYRLSPKTKIVGGVAFDDSPTDVDVRNPRAPNEDRVYAGLGITHDLGRFGVVKLGYAHTFFKDAPIALTAENNPGRGTLNGNIKLKADIFALQFVRQF